MPGLYISKVIAVGSYNSGKFDFFNSIDQYSNSFDNTSSLTIGVSIKVVKCLNDHEDILKMTIWDINGSDRFHSIYPYFFRGAKGCLLFFDASEDDLFNNLYYWIRIIKKNTDNIPIFLVGYKSDINYEELYDKINHFVENNQIENFFLISSHSGIKKKIILTQLASKILKNIGSESNFIKLEKRLRVFKKGFYKKFLNLFLICPICKRENHISYLKKFYFSKTSDLIKLRESLFTLIKKSKKIDNILQNEIKIGIPCCACHKNLFLKGI